MKRLTKKLGIVLMMVCMLMFMAQPVYAKAKMSKKKVTLAVGQTYKLKVKGIKGKTKWKSSNKAVVTVNKGVITANRKGSAKITAKVKGKKLTCKVTVKDNVFYGRDFSYFDRAWVDNARVDIKVTKLQFVSKDFLIITLAICPTDDGITLRNIGLTLADKRGQVFFDNNVYLVKHAIINQGEIYYQTINLKRKDFPKMRVTDLTTLSEKSFKYNIYF